MEAAGLSVAIIISLIVSRTSTRKKGKNTMRSNVRVFMAGFISCIRLFACATTAFAATNGTTVSAMLNGTVKMMLNSNEFVAKDDSGNTLLPITYNSRTYLPVRALGEALNVPIEYDPETGTIWIGERNETVQITTADQYKDYYATVITKDSALLTSPEKTYKWGITNSTPQSLATFGCYLMPQAKYSSFAASVYLDADVKMDLVLDIRKDTYDGPVIKSYTLSPGETVDIEAGITGVDKFYLISNIKMGHDTVNKLIIGEPVFKN